MRDDTGFLPNFCSARAVFLLVLTTELLALVLALAQGAHGRFWTDLALISLFVQWSALVIAAVLCLLRRPLGRLGTPTIAAITLLLVLGVTLGVSLAAVFGAHALWDAPSVAWAGFVRRNLAIAAIIALVVLRYFYVQHQWRLNVAAEARAREQALTARIRPHFLFNSLNTIASLVHERPHDAEAAVIDLADLFRAALHGRERVPLADEIDLARGYLRIERMRLGDRLAVDWRIADDLPLGLPVPTLILQPLVENAVRHGIEPSTEGGTVRVDIHCEGNRLVLAVSNPIPAAARPPDGNRTAQDNLRQRLALAYGDAARFGITDTDGIYRVEIRLPLAEGE